MVGVVGPDLFLQTFNLDRFIVYFLHDLRPDLVTLLHNFQLIQIGHLEIFLYLLLHLDFFFLHIIIPSSSSLIQAQSVDLRLGSDIFLRNFENLVD